MNFLPVLFDVNKTQLFNPSSQFPIFQSTTNIHNNNTSISGSIILDISNVFNYITLCVYTFSNDNPVILINSQQLNLVLLS